MLALATPAHAQDEDPPIADEEQEEGEAEGEDPEEVEPEEAEASPDTERDPFDEFRELDAQREERRPAAERPLELMTRDELDQAGFEFGAEASGRDTSGALLLAVTAGAAIHGIGHLYLGDTRTGFFLLALEAASLGLMFTSTAFYGLTEGASRSAAFFAPALQAGLAGFVFTYLADVLGVLTKDSAELKPNTSSPRGVGFRAQYGLMQSTGLPVRHLIDGQLVADVGGIYGSAGTTQDLFLDLAAYRGRIGVRPVRGNAPLTFVGIEAGGEYMQWSGDGEFGRIGADGRLILSYQLGRSFPHLSEFAMGIMGGLGNHWIQIAPAGTTTFDTASSRLWVPFDVFASLNVSKNLSVRGGYASPELFLVPPIHRLLGVFHTEFVYRSSSFGDISLRAEVGDGFALWLGGGLWLGR